MKLDPGNQHVGFSKSAIEGFKMLHQIDWPNMWLIGQYCQLWWFGDAKEWDEGKCWGERRDLEERKEKGRIKKGILIYLILTETTFFEKKMKEYEGVHKNKK